MSMSLEKLLEKTYPTGIYPLEDDDWEFKNKGIEDKIEIIGVKVNQIIEFINKLPTKHGK